MATRDDSEYFEAEIESEDEQANIALKTNLQKTHIHQNLNQIQKRYFLNSLDLN